MGDNKSARREGVRKFMHKHPVALLSV